MVWFAPKQKNNLPVAPNQVHETPIIRRGEQPTNLHVGKTNNKESIFILEEKINHMPGLFSTLQHAHRCILRVHNTQHLLVEPSKSRMFLTFWHFATYISLPQGFCHWKRIQMCYTKRKGFVLHYTHSPVGRSCINHKTSCNGKESNTCLTDWQSNN